MLLSSPLLINSMGCACVEAMLVKDENTKQRMKLQMKALPPQRPPSSASSASKLQEDKPTYKETFIPPEISMVSYFMAKVC